MATTPTAAVATAAVASAATAEANNKIKMLKEALKCVDGTLDFDKLAEKMEVANGEAM